MIASRLKLSNIYQLRYVFVSVLSNNHHVWFKKNKSEYNSEYLNENELEQLVD